VKGGGWRVEGGGWRVEGGVWSVECGGWKVRVQVRARAAHHPARPVDGACRRGCGGHGHEGELLELYQDSARNEHDDGEQLPLC
jgi:hypothetical protein